MAASHSDTKKDAGVPSRFPKIPLKQLSGSLSIAAFIVQVFKGAKRINQLFSIVVGVFIFLKKNIYIESVELFLKNATKQKIQM